MADLLLPEYAPDSGELEEKSQSVLESLQVDDLSSEEDSSDDRRQALMIDLHSLSMASSESRESAASFPAQSPKGSGASTLLKQSSVVSRREEDDFNVKSHQALSRAEIVDQVRNELQLKLVVQTKDKWSLLQTPGEQKTIWLNEETREIMSHPPNHLWQPFTQHLEELSKENTELKKTIHQLETEREQLRNKRQAELQQAKVDSMQPNLQTNEMADMLKKLTAEQSALRELKSQIAQSQKQLREADVKAKASKQSLDELLEKNEALKLQVRTEVDRNEAMERSIREFTQIKEDRERIQNEMSEIAQKLDNALRLLESSKKANKEYKERILDLENNLQSSNELQEDIFILQQENSTLKSLLHAKDRLIYRRNNTLEAARNIIRTLRCRDPEIIRKLMEILDKEDNPDTDDGTTHAKLPMSHGNNQQNGRYSQQNSIEQTFEMPRSNTLLSISTGQLFSSTGVRSSLSANHAHRGIQRNPSLERRAKSAAVTKSTRFHNSNNNNNNNGIWERQEISQADVIDQAGRQFLHLGDRVKILMNGQEETAVVKYLGKLDLDFKVKKNFVGLKLLSAVGDTDGVFRNVRYFSTPANRGKIIRICDIQKLYNIKTNSYDDFHSLVRSFLSSLHH